MGRLFLFSHQKGAIIPGKAIIRGRRLFKGGDYFKYFSQALNILFYYTEQKSEIHEHYHAKKPMVL